MKRLDSIRPNAEPRPTVIELLPIRYSLSVVGIVRCLAVRIEKNLVAPSPQPPSWLLTKLHIPTQSNTSTVVDASTYVLISTEADGTAVSVLIGASAATKPIVSTMNYAQSISSTPHSRNALLDSAA
jgi:hypothetical protein